MHPYCILIPVLLAVYVQAWDVIDGPSTSNNLPESSYRPYEVAKIREKLRQALDEMEQNSNELPAESMQQSTDVLGKQHDFDHRRSTITKNQLNLIVKMMRTRMFGSI